VAGGDLITGGLQSSVTRAAPRWDAYMAMQRAIKGNLFPVMGHHDLGAGRPADGSPAARDPRSVYRTRMGLDRTYYAFDAVGYHFVMLDSIQLTDDEFLYQGMIGPAQLDWLQRDLSRVAPETPIVLVTHMPLLTAFYGAVEGLGFTPPKNRVVVNNAEVLKIIANHNVILVLQGHLHVKEMIQWRGTTFITGGAVCGKWWRGPWYGTQEGFNTLTLTGDHVRWEYVDYGWEAGRPVQG
jgi:3',5'-cyclic-AMP phosphodiesterase